jgi:putative transposase
MKVFVDDVDRRRFLVLLAEVVDRYRLRCHAYCEMTNHYHLAVTTTDANLSRAFQQLNGDYAQWWNRRHQHVGHVLEARFGGQIVQDDAYLLTVCRYIVLNPVRAGIVAAPEQWLWSSYAAMIGLAEAPPFLDCNRVLELVSPDDPQEGRNRFRKWVEQADPDAVLPRDRILGDDAFVSRFQPYRAASSREVPRREGRRTLDAIFSGAVTRAARDGAIVAAVREGYPLTEIARYVALHVSTVSRIVSPPGARACKTPGYKT